MTAGKQLITGIIDDDPMILAAQAGMDLDAYSLARVGQSEEGTSSDLAKIAVMWATKNQAKKLGITVTSLVTHPSWKDRNDHSLGRQFPAADNKYSRQTFGKYASTITPPTENTKQLAVRVMQSKVADPTGGATKFDNAATQDALNKINPDKFKTSDEIAAKRTAAGMTLIELDGVSTRFWRQG